MPPWLQQVGRVFDSIYPIRIGKEEIEGNVTVTLGQSMFTPRDRTRTDLIVEDRPYAGWTYLGFGYNTRSSYRLDSFEINLGVVGPWSRAKQSQDLIHRARGISQFEGWANQLGNEFGAQVVFERKYRFDFLIAIEVAPVSVWTRFRMAAFHLATSQLTRTWASSCAQVGGFRMTLVRRRFDGRGQFRAARETGRCAVHSRYWGARVLIGQWPRRGAKYFSRRQYDSRFPQREQKTAGGGSCRRHRVQR